MELIDSYYNIFDNSKHLDSLLHDCKVAFDSKHLSNSNENYSIGSTYFIKPSEQARCYLESMALSIFNYHTKDMLSLDQQQQYDVNQSGAEWWTQVIDSRDEIGFHWDRDYDLEEIEGIYKYPLKATVTYLTNHGGPTFVLDNAGTSDRSISLVGNTRRFSISKPRIAKSIAFNGNLLHAAPTGIDELDDDEEDDNDNDSNNDNAEDVVLRVTLLVNIWINHIPSQAKRFPKKLISKMTPMTLLQENNIPLTWNHSISLNYNNTNTSNTKDIWMNHTTSDGSTSSNYHHKEIDNSIATTKGDDDIERAMNRNEVVILSANNCTHEKKWRFSNSDTHYDIIFPLLPCTTMSDLLATRDIINLSYIDKDNSHDNTNTSSNSISDNIETNMNEVCIKIIHSTYQSDDDNEEDDDDDEENDDSDDGEENDDSDDDEEEDDDDDKAVAKKKRYV